jgi:hypothetical protein
MVTKPRCESSYRNHWYQSKLAGPVSTRIHVTRLFEPYTQGGHLLIPHPRRFGVSAQKRKFVARIVVPCGGVSFYRNTQHLVCPASQGLKSLHADLGSESCCTKAGAIYRGTSMMLMIGPAFFDVLHSAYPYDRYLECNPRSVQILVMN